MKKLMLFVLLTYTVACSNPEDRATGDPDSTSFNQSGNEKNFNSGNEPENQSNINNNDTSSSPATMKQNANSKTDGTNRSYTPGGDSANQK